MSYFNFDDNFFDENIEVKETNHLIPTVTDEIETFVLDELKKHEETCISFTIENELLRHEFTLQKTTQGIILTKLNKPLRNYMLKISYYDTSDDIKNRLTTYINDLKYYI